MNEQTWSELQRLFRETLDRPEDEREAFVQSCALDDAQRRTLRELLDAYEDSAAFLEPPERQEPPPPPERIAGFRIVREIGRGGMGVVYEAEQSHPRRAVALKVLRTSAMSPQLARRFEHEAHLLARLQHPGIAQIHEAGSARVGDESVPYFAMELVRGLPLHRWLRGRKPDLEQRLELIARIADAVQHAHLSGVIHRDLKPSNILVTADGQPKVLDFGVARATDSDVQLTSARTDIGQLIGTLPYMSPEQTLGEPDELDTRSDVYALGVIAYEALAGRLPHDVHRKMPLEAVRAIQQDEAPRLSTISPRLRGDVETIVSKALEKDRARRYQTASDLAADLRRHLNDEPIVARPASRTYQIAKFARRNRALSVAIAALFVVLVAATAISTRLAVQRQRALLDTAEALALAEQRGAELEAAGRELEAALMRATQARDEAGRERAIANAVRDFLIDDVLEQGDPIVNTNRELSVADALASAGRSIPGRFGDAPDVEPAIRRVLAAALQHLRRHEEAALHSARVLELVVERSGADSLEARSASRDLAVMQLDAGRFREARDTLEQLHEIDERELEPDHPERLRTMANLGAALYVAGDNDRARELLQEAVLRAEGVESLPRGETWRWRKKLSEVLKFASEYVGALALIEALIDEQSAVLGDDHPFVLDARNSAALIHMERFEFARAEEIARDVAERTERVLGKDHLNTLSATTVHANILQRMGRFDEALALHQGTLEALRTHGEPAASDLLGTQYSMASIYHATGRLEEAEALAAQTFDAQVERFGEAHYFPVLTLNLLGMIHSEQDRLDEAAREFERMIELSTQVSGLRSANTASGVNNLASVYERLGRWDDALKLYQQGVELHDAIFGVDSTQTWVLRSNIGGLYLRLGRYEDAETLLRETTLGLTATLGASHWLVAVTQHKLAGALERLERREEALTAAHEALPKMEAAFGPEHARTVGLREMVERLESAPTPAEQR